MAVLSIHHVSLIVADTDRSVDFYRRILGLEIATNRPQLDFPGAWLNIGEQQIHLLQLDNPDPVTGRPDHGGRDRHLAISVDELQSIEKKLEQLDIRYSHSRSGRAALFCRDPDGNALELIQT